MPSWSDNIYGWLVILTSFIVTMLGAWRSWRADDRNAKYSELNDLRRRVDELSEKLDKLQGAHTLIQRYSGHLQYLLAQHGIVFPTLEQFNAELERKGQQ